MAINPYSSPLADDLPGADSRGVFRDGQSLVMPAEGVILPSICLKSLVETTGTHKLNGRFLPKASRGLVAVLGGAIGYAIALRFHGQQVSLTLPLCDDWKRTNRRKLVKAWVISAFSLLWIVAGAFFAYYHALLILGGVALTVVTMYLGRAKDAIRRPYFSRTMTHVMAAYGMAAYRPERLNTHPPLIPNES